MNSFFCRGLIFLFCISFRSHSAAQDVQMQRRLDSLKKVLITAAGADRFDALFGLAYEYSDEIDSLSLIYADQAYDLALKLGDSSRIIKAGRIKAGQLRRLENIDEAIQTAQYVLGIARRFKNTNEIKLLSGSLAASYTLKAEYDKALKYNIECLVLRESIGDKREISISLSNIGLVYYKLNDFEKSIEYYKKAREIKRQINDKYNLDRLLINTGLCLSKIGDYSEARKYIDEGLQACEGKCSDQIILEGQIALGMTFYETKSYTESLSHFERSYEIAKRIGNYRFQAENLLYFARIYLINKDYPTVLKYLKEAESISKQKGYMALLIITYKLFVKLHNDRGDYKNIALFQSKYISLKDSIYSENVIGNLAQLRADFEERENIRVIAEKNQVLSLKEDLLEKQKQQTLLVGFIGVLLLILTGAVYKNYRDKLLVNIKLDQKVKERTEELRVVNVTLTKAYELRESVFQKVSQDTRSIVLGIQGLCRTAQLDLADEKAREYIQRVEVNADKLVSIFSRVEN